MSLTPWESAETALPQHPAAARSQLEGWGATARSPLGNSRPTEARGSSSLGSDIAHLLEAQTQTVEASLSLEDPFNPTRFRRFQDDYVLEIEQTGTVDITLNSDAFDPFLQVVDPLTGDVLYENDDGGQGLNSRLSFAANQGDRLWVRATSYWRQAVGDYRLTTTVQWEGAQWEEDSPSDTHPITSPVETASDETQASETQASETQASERPPTLSSSEPASPDSTPSSSTASAASEELQARLNAIAPNAETFDSTTGYGLIDAGSAVATVLGNESRDLPNQGGSVSNLELIRAPEAWAQGATGQGVVVAVIDSGLDLDHPDLQGSIWTNPNEIAGDGLDNDGNGYIDDLHGWNFGPGQNNGDVRPGTSTHFQSHGTHVAGIIAANNDGLGTTGVAHNAQIMTLRLGDTTAFGNFRNAGSLIDAIYYAVNNGADIINLSLGWSDSPELRQALVYAAENNVITVSASGNSNGLLPVTPARFADQWGISVGAVDLTGDRLSFSNQAGRNSAIRHVMAPGSEIYSTEVNESYRRRTGTSMAAPFVSGAIALMLSANPDLNAEQIRNILTATTQQDRE